VRSGTATTRRIRLVIVLSVAAAVTVVIGAILMAMHQPAHMPRLGLDVVAAGVAREAFALEQEPDDTPEECWQRSVAHFAGDAISMRAFWTREFGAWEKFNAPSDVLTLIEQAATAWATLARDLSAANDLEIPMFLRRPNPEGAS
jgi:hypothetical protein